MVLISIRFWESEQQYAALFFFTAHPESWSNHNSGSDLIFFFF